MLENSCYTWVILCCCIFSLFYLNKEVCDQGTHFTDSVITIYHTYTAYSNCSFLIYNILLCNIHCPHVHISAHFKYSMLLGMQITPLSYCSVAPYLPWLEALSSFTVFIGANSIMDNAIEEAMSWKRMMLHMHIALMSYVSFSIEPLAMALNSHHHWHHWPMEQVLLWVMLLCKCCRCSTNTKPLAVAKVLLPERLPERRCPSAGALGIHMDARMCIC